MAQQQQPEPRRPKGISGMAIPAGIFIGMGIGFLTGELVAFMFIGMGVGFAATIALRLGLGEW